MLFHYFLSSRVVHAVHIGRSFARLYRFCGKYVTKGFRGNFSLVKRDWNWIEIVRTIVMFLVMATMAFSASIVLLVKALHLAKVFPSLHMV